MNISTDNTMDEDEPEIDKTFVEGSMPFPSSELISDKESGAADIKKVNLDFEKNQLFPVSLPIGNESITLGSGSLAGLIGSGGMSKVYKIWNEKLEVFRAVKILLPERQKELKSRFETEAKITAKLCHPNVVEIYNVGEWNGIPFIEMEFIDGDLLESLIARYRRLPDTVCCSIGIFIAEALVYAHNQDLLLYGKSYHGIIHRDLKPANIMISEKGEVKLMDFGIARPTEASLHTIDGNIVGTMQYLSPEQMDGYEIDCRTDIYSFGAILYEMLTGTKTFPQDRITDLMSKRIVNEYREFTEFDFPISRSLAKISRKCLRQNKEERYSSAEKLLSDLKEVHKRISSETPDKVIQRFILDPQSFVKPANRGLKIQVVTRNFIKITSIAVTTGLIGVILFVILLTHNNSSKSNTSLLPESNKLNLNKDAAVPTCISQSNESQTLEITPPTTDTSSKVRMGKKKALISSVTDIRRLDKLKQKYSTDDLFTMGKIAVAAGAFSEAIVALDALPDSLANPEQKHLLLLEAYIGNGQIGKAVFLCKRNINDAQYDFLRGRLSEKQGRPEDALNYYQNSLIKPSRVRNRTDVRTDALYYSALLWSKIYHGKLDDDSRIQATNAWNAVKRAYGNNPGNPRIKKADEELSSLR